MKIPNFEAVLEWERDRREEAFLGFVAPILDVPVGPLTLRRLGFLLQGGCAFLQDGPINMVAVAQFLWLVSPKFRPADLDARALFLADPAVIAAVGNVEAAQAEIRQYLDAAFNDAPASKVGGSTDEPPVTCFAASLVHPIARKYGWGLDQILDTPLAALYQLYRRIALEADEKAVFISRRSRKAKGDWLRSLRASSTNGESQTKKDEDQQD